MTCDGSPVEGATVTLTQGYIEVGTCTTDEAGKCCISATEGTYRIEASKTGYVGSNKTVDVTCPGETDVELDIEPTIGAYVWFQVNGCVNGAGAPIGLPGATVDFNGGSYTTDADGKVNIPTPRDLGTYAYSVSKDRFTTATGSVTVLFHCQNLFPFVGMTPADGYCCPSSGGYYDCPDPVSKTMHFTGPLGSLEITLNDSCGGLACGTFEAEIRDCTHHLRAGTVPYAVAITPGNGPIYLYARDLWFGTDFSAATWSDCGNTLVCPCGAFTCARDNTPLSPAPPTSITCPPGFTSSGTVSGLTGLGAVFNGDWTLSE